MPSLENCPNEDLAQQLTALNEQVLSLAAQIAKSNTKVKTLERQQRSDERQFKAIVKQQRRNQIFQAIMVLLAVCGLAGINITEEHQDKLIAAVVTVMVGAIFAPGAEGRSVLADEESE